jgi:hypothetical protein
MALCGCRTAHRFCCCSLKKVLERIWKIKTKVCWVNTKCHSYKTLWHRDYYEAHFTYEKWAQRLRDVTGLVNRPYGIPLHWALTHYSFCFSKSSKINVIFQHGRTPVRDYLKLSTYNEEMRTNRILAKARVCVYFFHVLESDIKSLFEAWQVFVWHVVNLEHSN